MANVEFEEENQMKYDGYGQGGFREKAGTTRMVRFVMQLGIKNPKNAEYILIAIAIIFFLLTIYTINKTFYSSAPNIIIGPIDESPVAGNLPE